MCSRCRAIVQYGPALTTIHTKLAEVIASNPAIVDPASAAAGIAAAFRILATALPETRSAAETTAVINALSPEDRRAAHAITGALAMIYSGVEDIIEAAMRHFGEPVPTDNHDEPEVTDTLDIGALLDKVRGADGADLAAADQTTPTRRRRGGRTRNAVAMRSPSPEDQAKVRGLLQQMAQQIAELTGGAVTVGELHEQADGTMKPVHESVAVPGGGFPIVGNPDKTLH